MRIKLLQIIDFYLGNILLILELPLLKFLSFIKKQKELPNTPQRIAVLKMLGGGSLILAGPELLALRKRYPNAVFTLIASKPVSQFGALLNVFDEIKIIDSSGLFRLCLSSLKVLFFCRTRKITILIDLEVYSRLTSIFVSLTGIPYRLGFYSNMAFLRKGIYTHLLFLNPMGEIYRFYGVMASTLKADPSEPEKLREKLRSNLPKKLPLDVSGKYLVIAPFCSELSRYREWLPANWSRFIDEFTSNHSEFSVYLIGGNDNYNDAEIIRNACKTKTIITNCCGKLSLPESAKLIKDAELFACIDSAPMHIARLLAGKVISLWGATSPKILLRPHNWLCETVIYAKSICSPCIHMLDIMTCSRDANCMAAISVDTVLAETEKLLASPRADTVDIELEVTHPINLIA